MGYSEYLYGRMKKGDIDSGNYTEFEEDGTFVMTGTATVFDDLQINLSSARLHPTNTPTWTDYKGTQVLAFGASNTNTAYFTAQMPHAAKTGADIDFHIHIAHPNANTGSSVWEFSYSWAQIGATLAAATVVTATVAAPLVADIHQYAGIGGGMTPNASQEGLSAMLLCSLKRTGSSVSDDYASDVYLLAMDFHVEKDMLGSRQELVK